MDKKNLSLKDLSIKNVMEVGFSILMHYKFRLITKIQFSDQNYCVCRKNCT